MTNPEQLEKLEVLRNDHAISQPAPTTYSALAAMADPAPGGRFALGAQEPNEVPRLPANSPWTRDPVGPEPPLGYAIDFLDPTGTPAEVEASLTQIEAGPASMGPAAVEARDTVHPSSVDDALAAGPNIRRRL